MGSTQCMFELGEIEVDDGDPSDALELFRKASEGGNVSAMLGLGVMYELGIVTFEDPQLSVYWYRRAVERGNLMPCTTWDKTVERRLGNPKGS